MNKILEIKFGSHLYGTDTPNSDLDLKGIYLPTAKEIVLGKYKKTISTTRPKQKNERNTKDDVDIEIFSLDRYLQLLTEGQTVAMDMLFANENNFPFLTKMGKQIFNEIYNNRERLFTKQTTAFIGYARAQAAKYGLKGGRVAAFRDTLEFLKQFNDNDTLWTEKNMVQVCKFVYTISPLKGELKNEFIRTTTKTCPKGITETYLEVCGKMYPVKAKIKFIRDQIQRKFDEYGKRALLAERNEGIDWKALSHAVRVNNQGIELFNTHKITFPRPDRQLLLDIKMGKLQYNEVANIITDGLEKLQQAKINSKFPDKPDLEWCDHFVYNIYSEIVKNV